MFKQKSFWILTSLTLSLGYWFSCTKHDQVLVVNSTTANSTVLQSIKTTTPPTIDGTIDASWTNAPKLNILPTVPDPGNGLFAGYSGQQYPATVRSMYDDQNIYFLVEIKDASQSVNVSPWYFDPAANGNGKTGWSKEPNSDAYDANGVLTRPGMGEDRVAMLWNIDNSTPAFLSQTCYASCHIFTPYTDYSKTPAIYTANASGNHYTTGATEKIDMWWARLGYISKDPSLHFMDDNYQDWAGGPTYTNVTGGNGNGRHVDGIVPDGTYSTTWPYRPNYTTSPTQGEVSNSQNLKLNGTGASVAVPIWVIPGVKNAGYILVADTSGGTAKKVTQVDSTGVLTLSDGTTINPNEGTDFQRTGDPVTGPTAANSIPSFIGVPLIGGRADITAGATYAGSGWIVEYKRALKTGDQLKQDIDFTSLQDQVFGMAVWNNSNYQHGIQPNLTLTFKK
jgi:Ethylbenzene dehydrogenase/Carbohydrate family 9 binding domain-like